MVWKLSIWDYLAWGRESWSVCFSVFNIFEVKICFWHGYSPGTGCKYFNMSKEVFVSLNIQTTLQPSNPVWIIVQFVLVMTKRPDGTTLRKYAYSNILKISPPKKPESFQIKILIVFIFLLENMDCWYSLEPPRRSGSNEYPQSMFSSRNKKNNVYPSKLQFYYIKMWFKRVKII